VQAVKSALTVPDVAVAGLEEVAKVDVMSLEVAAADITAVMKEFVALAMVQIADSESKKKQLDLRLILEAVVMV
jgi:hypothetical protein